MDRDGKRALVSGGAGFLGRALVARLLSLGSRVTVVSRDEDKHLRLRQAHPEVETRVCDVRDGERLRRLTAGHDVAVWAASLKQIDTCARDFEVAKEVIVDGAINARRASEEHLEAAVFVSTDKAKAQGWVPELAAMTPLGRAAEPEDIAEMIVFLASERNRYTTGENVIVGGGYVMH